MPEVALAGTAQEADSFQLPQSISPVSLSVRLDGGPPACAKPTVITHSVDVEPIVCRGRIDLKSNSLSLINADVGSKALDGRVAGTANVPHARVNYTIGPGVLAGDLIDQWIAGVGWRRRHR